MTAATSGPVPPVAPGALGDTLSAQQIQDYLAAMLAWRHAFRAALDGVDAQARAAGTAGAALSADVTLAYALWQSIGTRVDEIITTWDSGRVGRREREAASTLVWGRLDDRAGGLPVSLAEACVLADALLTRLAARVEDARIGGSGRVLAAAIRDSLERSRDLAIELSVRTTHIEELAAELDRVVLTSTDALGARAALSKVDAAASTVERDLIIAAAMRASLNREYDAVDARLRAAIAESSRIRRVAAECARRFTSPPHLAVPEPRALGAMPSLDGEPGPSRAALDAFGARLGRVEAALLVASERYGRPLVELEELQGVLAAYRAKSVALGYAADAVLQERYEHAAAQLRRVPCDLSAGRALIESYRHEVDSRQDGRGAIRSRTTDPKGGRG